jgi:hypothetical protein
MMFPLPDRVFRKTVSPEIMPLGGGFVVVAPPVVEVVVGVGVVEVTEVVVPGVVVMLVVTDVVVVMVVILVVVVVVVSCGQVLPVAMISPTCHCPAAAPEMGFLRPSESPVLPPFLFDHVTTWPFQTDAPRRHCVMVLTPMGKPSGRLKLKYFPTWPLVWSTLVMVAVVMASQQPT